MSSLKVGADDRCHAPYDRVLLLRSALVKGALEVDGLAEMLVQELRLMFKPVPMVWA